jgi:hypothetical protein
MYVSPPSSPFRLFYFNQRCWEIKHGSGSFSPFGLFYFSQRGWEIKHGGENFSSCCSAQQWKRYNTLPFISLLEPRLVARVHVHLFSYEYMTNVLGGYAVDSDHLNNNSVRTVFRMLVLTHLRFIISHTFLLCTPLHTQFIRPEGNSICTWYFLENFWNFDLTHERVEEHTVVALKKSIFWPNKWVRE